MGNFQSSIQKINFEDVQYICNNTEIYLLINTLPEFEQKCLIKGTINATQEEVLINKHVTGNKNIQIIIYGRNCNDESVFKKYQQLKTLGFNNIFIYLSGMFEWVLLQDIYGFEDFPTTNKELDILKYKPCQRLNIRLLHP